MMKTMLGGRPPAADGPRPTTAPQPDIASTNIVADTADRNCMELGRHYRQVPMLRRHRITRLGVAVAVAALAFVPAPGQATPGPKPAGAPEAMKWIPGAEFWMGSSENHFPDAQPPHRVRVPGFWMDVTEVTNRQFAAFVKATG